MRAYASITFAKMLVPRAWAPSRLHCSFRAWLLTFTHLQNSVKSHHNGLRRDLGPDLFPTNSLYSLHLLISTVLQPLLRQLDLAVIHNILLALVQATQPRRATRSRPATPEPAAELGQNGEEDEQDADNTGERHVLLAVEAYNQRLAEYAGLREPRTTQTTTTLANGNSREPFNGHAL